MQFIENRTFQELNVGDSAEISRTLTEQDIDLFSIMSGDGQTVEMENDGPDQDVFHKVVANGMWGGALISAVLGTELPGPGTVYVHQSLDFQKRVGLGDTVRIRVTVRSKDAASGQVVFDCLCTNGDGSVVVSGEARVIAPTKKVRRPRAQVPEVHLHRHGAQYDRLISATEDLDPILTAVVHPCDAGSLQGALRAREQGLIDPILIGPRARIEAAAQEAGEDLAGLSIVDAPHSHASAEMAVQMAREGRAEALMKGALHTDEVMSAAVDARTGLRTERRMSHVFVLDVPSYPKPLMITDAAINIAPDLKTKADIAQNSIELAQALGVKQPRIAILAAVETVYPSMPSTIEAAALCKMADRGQITGGLLDGPLAFDNAISKAAANTKGIVSDVAGAADILLAPDLEAGNMIAKQLIYLAGAESAGLVLGAKVPIMLTSRADGIVSRVASAALAQLLVRHRWRGNNP